MTILGRLQQASVDCRWRNMTVAKVITYLYVVIGVMMFVFAALQLTSRKREAINLYLGVLFFCFGYVWMYFGLFRATGFVWAPWLLYSDVLATFLLGPIMYGYTNRLAGKARDWSTRRILPFLPALSFLVYLVVFRPWTGVALNAPAGPDPDYYAVRAIAIFNTIGDAYFFCYALISTRAVFRLFVRGNREFRTHFRGVLVYFLVGLSTFAIYLAGHIADSDSLLAFATLINGINATYFFFLSYRWPEYTQRAVHPPSARRRSAPKPNSGEVQRVLSRLEAILEDDDGYRDPGISLQSLSTRLGIQHYRLSRILNDNLGVSFRSYINRRRLDEAKRLLTERPEMSILDVTYTVGFNSKSAFDSCFKKETGLSPSDFRKTSTKSS